MEGGNEVTEEVESKLIIRESTKKLKKNQGGKDEAI